MGRNLAKLDNPRYNLSKLIAERDKVEKIAREKQRKKEHAELIARLAEKEQSDSDTEIPTAKKAKSIMSMNDKKKMLKFTHAMKKFVNSKI